MTDKQSVLGILASMGFSDSMINQAVAEYELTSDNPSYDVSVITQIIVQSQEHNKMIDRSMEIKINRKNNIPFGLRNELLVFGFLRESEQKFLKRKKKQKMKDFFSMNALFLKCIPNGIKILILNYFYPMIDTLIMHATEVDILQEWIEIPAEKTSVNLELIFRASVDGFTNVDFHRKCDNFCPTITVIASALNGNICGGFTEKQWNHSSSWLRDQSSFIFLLRNVSSGNDGKIGKYPVKPSTIPVVYCHENYGPSFGNGPDIEIHKNNICLAHLAGGSVGFTAPADNELFGGRKRFEMRDYEVFHVTYE